MSINIGILESSRSAATGGSLLLDTYGSAAAAYSLRLLRTAYTGSAIRVRRSSDNTETDIGFVLGVLDTSSLTTFVGVGNGFVKTWYDQSGNARDATQTTAVNQPQIIVGGVLQNVNGKPSVLFTIANSTRLTRAGILSGAVQRTQMVVYKTNASATQSIFGQGTDALSRSWSYIQSRIGAVPGDPYFSGFSADLGANLTTQNTDLKIGNFMYNGTTGYLWKNNTQITSGALTLNTGVTQLFQIAASGGGSGAGLNFFGGLIPECILWTSNQLANISAINTNINSFYTIY